MAPVYALPHLLTLSAVRDGAATAVEDGDRSLTYAELERLSNHLAASLRASGVRKGDRVGIFLKKSLEAVVSVYGIMKAGACYVPLDPNSPTPRIAYIVRDCRMKGLITDGARLERLQAVSGGLPDLRVAVVADADVSTEPTGEGAQRSSTLSWGDATGSGSLQPDVGLTECDLAFILYTSGSTGDPKGVKLSHRAALTFVEWASAAVGLTAEDRLSQHAPLHFDLSTFDIYGAAAAGATLVLVPQGLGAFPRSVADFIERKRISVWYSVPSVLTSLVTDGGLERHGYDALRVVIFAGEVFPTKYLRLLMLAIPGAEYHNWYGPTETNVCTAYHVDEPPAEGAGPIPIGRACQNTEVFSVSDDGGLAGVGETGELLVHGPSVMDGYWGLPERTDDALVPHPFRPESGRPAYRTGDLVRLAEDGNYHFVGRRDNMVKVRGYRVELGEVEAALYAHGDVASAAVLAVPDADGTDREIAAVVVVREGASIEAAELIRHCAGRLPKYMVPSFVRFEADLPKTSTGKVDRKRLATMRSWTDTN